MTGKLYRAIQVLENWFGGEDKRAGVKEFNIEDVPPNQIIYLVGRQ